ncbi:hypothetical protein [Aurantimonas coralicida]|uniref:hypothetical protein n=1 Tax=Aurantimonas coralicida TaxID=182270 RepID=UPI00238D7A7F|nr:hypothetical protein [Aurantimonas coralicida]MDE0922506.1 hypothetical protein [Aurantimonas coralicida]
MTMDLMHLEDFLDARAVVATREANRHLSEKARHEDEAERNKEVAVYCERAAVRIRGLREYLMQAPSGIAIEISAMVKADPAPEPAPVDERPADPVAGGDDGAEGTASIAPAEAGPVRDDPVPADTAVADLVLVPGDDVPADAEVGDDRGTEGSGAGEAGKEAHAGRKNSRAIAPEVVDRMAVLWDEGKTVREIAEAVGLTKGTVAGTTFRLRDRFPKREPLPFKPKPEPAQSPMAERLVPRPVPAPYSPTAIGNVREIAPLMNEMRAFFAKCEAKQPGGGIHEVASLEIRFNTTDLRIERALTALAEAGEIEWSASLKGHVTVRALRMAEAAE